MQRRTLVLTLLAGLLVFLAVLVLYLPASWCGGFLPPQVRCAQLGGSLWRGDCLGLQIDGKPLGNATWNLAVGPVFGGRLVGDVQVRGSHLDARADLDLKFDGSGELRQVNGRFPLDPAFLPQMPPNQRGRVSVDLQRVQLSGGAFPRQLQGAIELHDLQQVGANPLQLGSYRLTFDGAVGPDGTTGQLRDIGGPFAVDGTVTLSPPNGYLVQGFITGRTAQAERLVREITLGVSPDAAGRSQFSFEGSY